MVLYKKKRNAEERHPYKYIYKKIYTDTHIHCERFTVLRGRRKREVALGTERGEGQRRNPLTGHGYLEVAVSHIRKGVGGKKMKFHPSCYLKTTRPEIANFQTGQHPSPVMG